MKLNLYNIHPDLIIQVDTSGYNKYKDSIEFPNKKQIKKRMHFFYKKLRIISCYSCLMTY